MPSEQMVREKDGGRRDGNGVHESRSIVCFGTDDWDIDVMPKFTMKMQCNMKNGPPREIIARACHQQIQLSY